MDHSKRFSGVRVQSKRRVANETEQLHRPPSDNDGFEISFERSAQVRLFSCLIFLKIRGHIVVQLQASTKSIKKLFFFDTSEEHIQVLDTQFFSLRSNGSDADLLVGTQKVS